MKGRDSDLQQEFVCDNLRCRSHCELLVPTIPGSRAYNGSWRRRLRAGHPFPERISMLDGNTEGEKQEEGKEAVHLENKYQSLEVSLEDGQLHAFKEARKSLERFI